jgi:solute carrier family 25 (adenine nucleotide translocator) protein 4/5/6/31
MMFARYFYRMVYTFCFPLICFIFATKGGYDILKHVFDLDNKDATVVQKYFVAQANTTIVGTLCYPIDTMKRRLMVQGQGNERVYSGIFDCFSKILREEGTRGLFAGLSVNIFRGVFGAVMLVLYDHVRPVLSDAVIIL